MDGDDVDSEEYEEDEEDRHRKKKKKDRFGGFIIDEAEVDDEVRIDAQRNYIFVNHGIYLNNQFAGG